MSATAQAGAESAATVWLRANARQLAFGLRLTASVCLALYVAFALQVEDPSWAGTSAAITCQPVLGAALRKGQFRFLGTVVGAVFVVLLSAAFPQERIGFLGGLVAWAGLCCFAASLLKGPAAYAAQLAGYTAAIIADSSIADPHNVFILALSRATEITIGIACATVILGATDLGAARQRLAQAVGAIARDVRAGFRRTLTTAGATLVDAQTARRALITRLAAIDPLMDNALGESAALRFRRPALRAAFAGLFGALSGWRTVALHLHRLSPADAEAAIRPALDAWPADAAQPRDPAQERDRLQAAARRLVAAPAETPTQRLLADQTAAVWRGLAGAENALVLLASPQAAQRARRLRTARAPDPLPALVNAGRVMVAFGLACVIWVVTAWPSGLIFITFTAVPALLLAPQNEAGLAATARFIFGSTVAALVAGFIEFALLPMMDSYAGFCLAIGIALVPLGMLQASPRWGPRVIAASTNVIPILGPTNQATYNTLAFYNTAFAITAGCVLAALVLWLLPPLPPARRADRLARATLRDLRRLARGQWRPADDTWQTRLNDRLACLPPAAPPLAGARIVTALLIGAQMLRLRRAAERFGATADLAAAAEPFAAGDLAAADHAFRALDARLAAVPPDRPGGFTRLRARAALREIVEAMAAHPDYFGASA
jgi:uncharacterized membrane protein YccC